MVRTWCPGVKSGSVDFCFDDCVSAECSSISTVNVGVDPICIPCGSAMGEVVVEPGNFVFPSDR